MTMGNEIQLSLPLILISVLSVAAIVIDALSGKNKGLLYLFSIAGLIITAAAAGASMTIPLETVNSILPEESLTKGMISFGGYAAFFDILFCLAGIMTLFAARQYMIKEYQEYKEFYSLILLAISGMMYIVHAANMIILFIGIEIMSLAFYVLSGFIRTNLKSVEAALKYFLLGAFATGFLLYGIAMIYGATGSIDIGIIAEKVRAADYNLLYLTIGFGLMIIGLSFKVAAFPFHQWAPDVYEGAPTVVTAFMSTAGKAAAVTAFIIVGRAIMPQVSDQVVAAASTDTARLIIAIISAATMLVGNISAVVQKNVKRMLAYSSVAHAGYMLMGIVANNDRGWAGIAFYASAYLFMQIGSFVVVSLIENKEKNLMLDDYAGLSKTQPALAAMMALFMFSLAGIPPMAGFFGKYYLFAAAIEAGFTWLTILAVISSIISVYFYIGLVVQMYFKEQGETEIKVKTGAAGITLAISVAGILIFGFFPSLLMNIAEKIF